MAARRNNQAKRTGGGSGTPGWMWLLIGLVIGAVALLVVKKGDDGGFYTAKSEPQPRPNADATPLPRASEEDEAPAPKAVAKPSEPTPDAPPATQYQFYDALLAGKEVAISDADLAARARTEQQQAKPSAAATPAQKPVAAIPQPIDETPAAAAPAAASPAPKSTSTVSVAASPASRDDSRYLLQAGAFAASGDAEATKAKIALLGLSARVESAEISGNTVYRVRMGPYGSASELSEAKQKLASGGLQALAIKAQ